MVATTCYRFVKEDLTSANGEMSWKLGEWNEVAGKIVCCTNGLHAALTARDSLRYVHGERWFIAEARGALAHQDAKFAASAMRLVEEIPSIVLRRFAVWCARDCLTHYMDRYPTDRRLSACVLTIDGYLDGGCTSADVGNTRAALMAALSPDSGSAAGRAAAATVTAALAAVAPHPAAWAAAAAASAHAAHTAAAAALASRAAADAVTGAYDAVAAVAAADAADAAAASAHAAAAAAGVAHAASVAAAHGVAAADHVDPYVAARAVTAHASARSAYAAQAARLLEMIRDAQVARS